MESYRSSSSNSLKSSSINNPDCTGFFTHKDTLNNIYGILLVALFITFFEIVLYYFIIIPRLRSNITNGINTLTTSFKNMGMDSAININNIIDNLLTKIFENEELLNMISVSVIKKGIQDLQNEINQTLISNVIRNIKNEIISEIKREIKNNVNKDLINDVVNDVVNDANENVIENFESSGQNNRRKYNQNYNKAVGKQISDIIMNVLRNNGIDVNDNISKNIETLITTDFNNKISNILHTMLHDEDHIIGVNNNNTMVISVLIVFILGILLLFVRNLISPQNIDIGGGVEYKVYATSMIIVIVIIIFQINFFFFSNEYKYLGGANKGRGYEEIIVHLLKEKK